MRCPQPTTIDFETHRIDSRPAYPPRPVGVSIKKWGKTPRYYAWGHPTENNCTEAEARAALVEAFATKEGVLCHHAKFDLDVAEVHLKLKPPAWQLVHDTLFLLFLYSPNERDIGLKPSAARELGLAPDEQEEVRDWLIEHQPVDGVKITKAAQGKNPWGAYIAYAPGKLVGKYANGDTLRTEGLFRKTWPYLQERGMLPAYDRERELLPIFLEMERTGIRVDVARLERDIALYQGWQAKIDVWLRRKLKVGPEVNLQAGQQLLAALEGAGFLDRSLLGVTEKGNPKTGKEALAAAVSDRQVSAVLQYASQLRTCLGTFMEPWLATAQRSGGLIFTNWHQTKSPDGGTRTGRLSSSDSNFQNMPKEFAPIWKHEGHRELDDKKRSLLVICPFKGLPDLPLCRGYIVPLKPGHVLVGRDYSQQEPRILAHFEGGALLRDYQANPWIDFHDNNRAKIEDIFKIKLPRKPIKNIGLGLIYGQGAPSLAAKNGQSLEETLRLRKAVLKLYPGLDELNKDMKSRAQNNEPIRTWGGREYYCEKPAIIKGKFLTFEYKMVNTLIQGSAADCTKEAILRYWRVKPKGHHLVLQVHDELVISVPTRDLVKGQVMLRDAMESVEFDVKILSEGAFSNDNWGAMEDWDKAGKRVS